MSKNESSPPSVNAEPLASAGIDKIIAFMVTAVVFVGVCCVLRKRGLKVMVTSCLFVTSLTTTQLVMRQLSSPPLRFRYPGLITSLHFFVVWILSVTYWIAAGDINKCFPSSLGSKQRFLRTVIPIALTNPLTVVFNNIALVHIGAGLCAVIGTVSPIATAGLARMYGQRISPLSKLGMVIACFGAVMIVRQELISVDRIGDDFLAVTTGLCFALLSVAARAFKIVLMDHLLAPAAYHTTEPDLAPLHVYALQAPFSFLVSLLFASGTENFQDALGEVTLPVISTVGLTCVSAGALNFLGILSLKDLGASMQQLIGKLNTICTMALSVGLLGERMSVFVLFGSFVVLVGVGVFEHGKHVPLSSVTDEQFSSRNKV